MTFSLQLPNDVIEVRDWLQVASSLSPDTGAARSVPRVPALCIPDHVDAQRYPTGVTSRCC